MANDQDNPGVLVLYPLRFTSANYPVISDPLPPAEVPVGGLAHSTFVLDVTRREGTTEARIDPPSGGGYDAIALYMTTLDDPRPLLIERKLAREDPNEPILFKVFQSLFVERVNIFFYVVERSSGNTGPSTASWALYHHQLPGGNDAPGTGDHPHLKLSLPPELGDPPRIGQEEAAKGVPLTVSYPYGQPYDNILLMLNGKRFTFTLKPGEENQPYVILLTQDLLEQAGNNPAFEIRYTVISQVNNPTHQRRESRVIVADIDLAHTTLDAPILREDLDDSADDPALIDRDKLKGGPLWVMVLPHAPTYQAGDTVQAIYRSTPPDLELPMQGTVEKDGLGQFKPCLMPVANDKVISGSQVRVAFELVRNGQVVGRSKAAVAQVLGSGEEPGPLKAPGVPAFDDGLVTDADARTPLQVLIPKFDKARKDDGIVIRWGKQSSTSVPLKEEDLDQDPMIGVQIPFNLVRAALSPAESGSVAVSYDVYRNGKLVASSPVLNPVEVDLSLIGGPDPDPDPEHGNLQPATVFSFSGEQNDIPADDFDKNATAVIAWLAKDATELYQVDDRIEFIWGDQTGTPVIYTVQPTDVTDKVDLRLPVPGPTIERQGSGIIPVFYRATRKLSRPPHENTSLSPKTQVTVANKAELPGGGTLPSPTFPVLNVNDAIGPKEILEGPSGVFYNPVRVALDYSNVDVGDSVELFFVGYDALTGGNLVPGAEYTPPAYPITDDDITRGWYAFNVPAVHHYAVCSRGGVEVHVIITNAKGATTSDKKRVFCDVKEPSWENCNNKP